MIYSTQPKASGQRAWVRLPSGNHLDLVNPDPYAWTDEDLASRLARTYRWSGESQWPLPMSVAQHALMVLALYRQQTGGVTNLMAERRELHHDSDEGLFGFDCVSPLKPILGDPFKALCARLQEAVFRRYDVSPWTAKEYQQHKYNDRIAAAGEAVHVVGWSRREAKETLGMDLPPLETDPLAQVYDCRPWEPWSASVAAERFLAEMRRLMPSKDKTASA